MSFIDSIETIPGVAHSMGVRRRQKITAHHLYVRFLFSIAVLPAFTESVLATHIIGGQLEMVMADTKAGHFKLRMTYYYNEAQTANLPQPSSDVVIFRKSDNKQMAAFTLTNTTLLSRPPIAFSNPACALANNLRMSRVVYETDIQLELNDYNDPLGYYLIQQNCCRNANIANLVNPQSTPFLFYLEFPPLVTAGQPFLNSSPTFLPLTGDYICLGKPFTFPTAAVDADGDELRYSLVSPLAGTFISNAAVIKPAPYPEVSWRSGYNPQRAIPGSPALTVDEWSGMLSVTANQQGLFVFSVRVEEFRRGVKIGEVRRDLQLLVIDCPRADLPIPVIHIQNQPVTATVGRLCTGKSIVLQTTPQADWNYQWSRNSTVISGATSSTLGVTESGDYTVSISLASTCSPAVRSEKVTIHDTPSTTKLLTEGPIPICKNQGTAQLVAPLLSGYTYQWLRDGAALSGQTSATVVVNQPGQYAALLNDTVQGCTISTEAVVVAERPDPVVGIKPVSSAAICPGDSLLLTGTGAVSYRWSVDGSPIRPAVYSTFYAKAPGVITVMGTDAFGCQATSSPLMVTSQPPIPIVFDSVATICGASSAPVPLRATPSGGLFSGKGVKGDVFDPAIAGVGLVELTYRLDKGVNKCPATARRKVDVAPFAGITLPTELAINLGESVELQPVITGQAVRFSWTPTTFLTRSDQAHVQAVAIGQDILYRLAVTTDKGCQSKDSVQIRIQQRIWVPRAFTPNNDGTNDTWQLTGIDTFPKAQLTIYNRWGEVIYRASAGYVQPFDGTYNGQLLPAGSYSYVLQPAPNLPTQTGWLMLIR